MALALGDSILLSGGRVDALAAAQAFDAWMRRKPVDIGNTVRRNLVLFRHTGKPRLNPSAYIVDTLVAVFQSFFDTECFEDCLVDVVNRGGDADTTGAIAGMLAGARYGLSDIPERWINGLNPQIRATCLAQSVALLPQAGHREAEHDR